MNQMTLKTTAMLAFLISAVALTGCTGVKNSMRLSSKDSAWNPVSKLKAEKEIESPPSQPETLVATWKGTTYQQPGERPVNGFGGRLYFYDKDNNAVEADGELFIYGFDNSRETTDDTKADKKFVFRSTEFQTHKSDSGFGVSYSVWCPWEKVGGYRKTITLIPIFKTADGRMLKGGQSINILHGPTPDTQMSDNKPYKVLGSSPAVLENADFQSSSDHQSEVSQVSFDSPQERGNQSIKTSTINLTPSMARRVATQGTRVQNQAESVMPESGGKFDHLKSKEPSFQAETQDTAPPTQSAPPRRAFGAPGSFN